MITKTSRADLTSQLELMTSRYNRLRAILNENRTAAKQGVLDALDDARRLHRFSMMASVAVIISAFFFELPVKLAPRARQIQPGTAVKAAYVRPTARRTQTGRAGAGNLTSQGIACRRQPCQPIGCSQAPRKTWTPPGIGTEWSGGA
jgi:hypothetical protein